LGGGRGQWLGRRSETGKRKGREEGEGGADRWGRRVSICGGKEKKKEEAGRCGRWRGGPWADWAKREVRSFSFLFFFLFFKLFSNQTFSTQIQTKLFKLFHKVL
jgi:hypothetical protein